MSLTYNLPQLFHRLPLDIKRHIYEFDNTYHDIFRSNIFKKDLIQSYFLRPCITHTVKELVFCTLETFQSEQRSWYPMFAPVKMRNGKIIDKNTHRIITDIRSEIDLFFSPFDTNILRWKYVYKGTVHLYKETDFLYDGCIAIQPDRLPILFYAGRVNSLCTEIEEIPIWCRHIGSIYWI